MESLSGMIRMQVRQSDHEVVYQRYFNKVFGYVIKRVSSRADAEDIASEIFLKLLSRPNGFDPDQKGASTYVFRTMQTTLTDYYRSCRITFEPLDENTENTDRDEDYDELLTVLDHALETLPKREQSIVVLHYYHGLSHKEIAEKMQLSYTNVRQLCHTALLKLRKEMEDYE